MLEGGGEFEFIRWLRDRMPQDPRVPVGIGDDAAWLASPGAAGLLVTTDMLMEGTDFLLAETPSAGRKIPRATPEQVGRKALAVNLSDIAAMGGSPLAAFLSVALPRSGGSDLARRLWSGVQELATAYDVALAGGDTNTWDGPLVINVCLLGTPIRSRPILRSGAQPGDWLFVTGPCGGSLLGRHLSFTPRVREAAWLVSRYEIRAMLDISDGLAQDLGHLCEASGVGVELQAEQIPIAPAAKEMEDGQSPLAHALRDGEDFELLLALSPTEGARLCGDADAPEGICHIGVLTEDRQQMMRHPDGSMTSLATLAGWVHAME